MRLRRSVRRGVKVVEATIVYPVFLLLLLGMMLAAVGVFRYQEIAGLAREGARYAAVRGYTYSVTTAQPAATPTDVYENVIKPRSILLDQNELNYSVTWTPDNRQGSLVKVQIDYHWVPSVFFGGMTLSSTACMPVSY